MAGSEIEIKARTRIWEDSETTFETQNHVLKRGEEVVILNPVRRKVGDGTSTFNELPFDNNHNFVSLGDNSDVITLYNMIIGTSFAYRRTNATPSGVVLVFDSFKDSARSFSQCDGRVHKIFVENSYSNSFEIEFDISSAEWDDESKITDLGVVTIQSGSAVIIEFCWLKLVNGTKYCYIKVDNFSAPSLNPSFVPSQITVSGANSSAILYNEGSRKYYVLSFNISPSVMTISISQNQQIYGTMPATMLEHYCLVKNTSTVDKILVIQGVQTGSVIVSEGLTSISIPAGKSFEFGYIWVTRGSQKLCVITKSNMLSEVTV